VSAVSSLIPVTTSKVSSHLPLLDLIPDRGGLSWVRGGQGLVGWGQYAKTTVKGPNRFRDARQWWEEQLATFNVVNTLNVSGTGPILFTSFSFNEDEESVLVIPEIVVGTRAGVSWMTWIGDKAQPYLPKKAPALTPAEFSWGDGSLTPNEWMSRVATAIGEIEIGDLEKVVLARDLVAVTDKEIDIRPILNNLSEQYPSTWIFAVDNLIGATPELLLRLSRGMVTSRVLAGTISKTGDDEKDLALAASLARSSKDLEEHEYAVRSVADALEPFCTSTNVPESPFVLHLANVMHLATDVTGALIESKVDVDAFSLLSRLHPSAAVCGTPTHLASQLIASIEGMNRGRYAGPVGWIDSHGDGELGIALRCGKVDGTSIRMFAGCGIVSGSNPEKELNESNAKFTPMRSALK
jgi:menaquinone-specific isochorismate synthase